MLKAKENNSNNKNHEIVLNTPTEKWFYRITIIFNILLLNIFFFIIVLFLMNYGKHTIQDNPKKKNVLNRSYQIFIIRMGIIQLKLFYLFIGLIILFVLVNSILYFVYGV